MRLPIDLATQFVLLMAVATIAPVFAQGDDSNGETTYTSRGHTWTASLDDDGDPVQPGLAHVSYTQTAPWSLTRTRNDNTVVIGYDDDDDPLFTQTLAASTTGHSLRTTIYPEPTSISRPSLSADRSSTTGTVYITPSVRPHYESISGYYPPKDSAIPSPSGYTSGGILRLDQLPGYNGQTGSAAETAFASGRPVYGGTNFARRALPTPALRDVGPPGRVRV